MLNELSIKVNIADRFYPLKVTPEQEVIVRQAAKLINDKLKGLQQQFEVRDKQDMLGMTLLEVTSQLLTLQQQVATDNKQVEQNLHDVQTLLKHISI